MNDELKLKNNLKEARAEKKLSQTQLAELIVFLDTPIISASCVWDSFFSARASLRLFFNFSSSFIP